MSTSTTTAPTKAAQATEVIVYGHSWLLYWWPVWAVGYLMALLTWLHPVHVQIDGSQVWSSSFQATGSAVSGVA
jgi:hypothetical protein